VIVRFEDVGFGYPGRAPALAGVNLSIEAGQTVALVGRSGAGKSTLLKLVNRLLLPSSGSVRVEGRDTRAWDPIALRRHVGYVFQDVGLFPHMTIEENVSIVPKLQRWSTERTRARARELLALVGLDPDAFASRRPRELSGGQRQRVGVARALAIDPPILLMDEPFGALDPLTRAEIRQEFARLRDRLQTTVILVTHDIGEALALGSRVGVLDSGALLAYDTPDRIGRSTDPRIRAFMAAQPARPPS
jgi:osmoprotectant transport system ATP-binding protein